MLETSFDLFVLLLNRSLKIYFIRSYFFYLTKAYFPPLHREDLVVVEPLVETSAVSFVVTVKLLVLRLENPNEIKSTVCNACGKDATKLAIDVVNLFES